MPSHDFPGLYHFHSFWFMVYHVLSMSQHSSMFSSTSIYCICLLSHPESAPRPDTHHIIRNASGLASSLGFSREAAAWLKFKSQDEFWSGNVWKLKCKQCNAQIDAERKRLFWTALQRATFGFVHVCVGLAGLHHSMPLSLQGTQLATNAPCDRKISKEKQSHQGHHWSFCKIRTCNILQRRQGCKHHRREKAQEVFEKSLQKAATKAAHATLHEVLQGFGKSRETLETQRQMKPMPQKNATTRETWARKGMHGMYLSTHEQ